MNRRQLIRLAIALGVVLFLWGLAEIIGGGPPTAERVALLEPVDRDAVTHIEIVVGEGTIRFGRSASGWDVQGFRADGSAVGDLLAAVADTLDGELVARSANSHARLGVDADSGRIVRLLGEAGSLAEVVVGKRGRAFGSVYVRAPSDDRVYQVRNDLATYAGRSITDWRDKTMFEAQPMEIGAVSVARDGHTYRIARAEGWTLEDGSATDSAAVARLVQRLGKVIAQGAFFATPEKRDSLDLSSPDRRVIVYGLGGDTLADFAMVKDESRYWVQRSGDEAVFQLFEWRVNDITPADSTIRLTQSPS